MNKQINEETLSKAGEKISEILRDSGKHSLEINKSSATRLVWFVAICGYVIFNWFKELESISIFDLLCIVPWLLTIFAAILAHWYIGSLDDKNLIHLTKKIGLFSSFSFFGSGKESQLTYFMNILNDKHENLIAASIERLKVHNRASFFEKTTLVFLFISFVSLAFNFLYYRFSIGCFF